MAATARKSIISGTNKITTRDIILDAAEIKFSKRGYDACTLRIISTKYGINLGLIHYYFGGKENLFKNVFLRRSATLVDRRRELLTEALRKSKNEPLEVSKIIECFIAPIIAMMREGEGPKAYIHLQGWLRTDTSDFARKLRGQAFNVTNNTFIREFQRSCDYLEPATVVWRFSAMVGAFYSFISHAARVNELSGGVADSDDMDSAYAEVVPFVTGGFLAPPSNVDKRTTKRSPRRAARSSKREKRSTS